MIQEPVTSRLSEVNISNILDEIQRESQESVAKIKMSMHEYEDKMAQMQETEKALLHDLQAMAVQSSDKAHDKAIIVVQTALEEKSKESMVAPVDAQHKKIVNGASQSSGIEDAVNVLEYEEKMAELKAEEQVLWQKQKVPPMATTKEEKSDQEMLREFVDGARGNIVNSKEQDNEGNVEALRSEMRDMEQEYINKHRALSQAMDVYIQQISDAEDELQRTRKDKEAAQQTMNNMQTKFDDDSAKWEEAYREQTRQALQAMQVKHDRERAHTAKIAEDALKAMQTKQAQELAASRTKSCKNS